VNNLKAISLTSEIVASGFARLSEKILASPQQTASKLSWAIWREEGDR